MNWWAVIIIVFAVGLLPWQIFRYARRRNDGTPKAGESKPKNEENTDGFW